MKTLNETTNNKSELRFAILLVFISLIFFLASCSEDKDPVPMPVSAFAASSQNIYTNSNVTFTNTSTDADSYLWEFGDGTTSIDFEPSHSYESEGEYTVSLTVSNASGQDIATTVISVTDEPIIYDFDYSTKIDDAPVSSKKLQYSDDKLSLNLFEVTNSANDTRPLVILEPGGGWKTYNQEPELNVLASDLAKRGYVVAVVQYTVGSQNAEVWMQSYLDTKIAVRFFKKNAETYRIDPAQIFTGGWSSGAQLAMYTAHLSIDEYENFSQPFLRNVMDPAVTKYGFDPSVYSEYSDDVKGNLLLMPYAWDETFFDADGPAVMMIANENSILGDGTRIWDTFMQNGISHIGPDVMFERLLSAGYVDGENLELILTDTNELTRSWSYVNYHSLDPVYFDAIAKFFKRNLD